MRSEREQPQQIGRFKRTITAFTAATALVAGCGAARTESDPTPYPSSQSLTIEPSKTFEPSKRDSDYQCEQARSAQEAQVRKYTGENITVPPLPESLITVQERAEKEGITLAPRFLPEERYGTYGQFPGETVRPKVLIEAVEDGVMAASAGRISEKEGGEWVLVGEEKPADISRNQLLQEKLPEIANNLTIDEKQVSLPRAAEDYYLLQSDDIGKQSWEQDTVYFADEALPPYNNMPILLYNGEILPSSKSQMPYQTTRIPYLIRQ